MGLLQILHFAPRVKVNRHSAQQAADPLMQALNAADYKRCFNMLHSVTSADYAAMLWGVSSQPQALALVQAWVLAEPGSLDGAVFLGTCLMEECLRLRASLSANASEAKPGDEAAKEQVNKKSMELAVQAQNLFEGVIEADRAKSEAYAGLIRLGYMLNRNMDRLHACFINGVKHDMLNFACFYQFFLATLERYGGSHKLMFDFLRWAEEYAPAGDYIHVLTACAYNELALSEFKNANGQWGMFRKKMRNADYRRDVAKALYGWLNATDRNLAPSLFEKEGILKQYALNQFAVALYLTGAREETKAVILELGEVIQPAPWSWFAISKRETRDPGFVYDRFNSEIQRKF